MFVSHILSHTSLSYALIRLPELLHAICLQLFMVRHRFIRLFRTFIALRSLLYTIRVPVVLVPLLRSRHMPGRLPVAPSEHFASLVCLLIKHGLQFDPHFLEVSLNHLRHVFVNATERLP